MNETMRKVVGLSIAAAGLFTCYKSFQLLKDADEMMDKARQLQEKEFQKACGIKGVDPVSI